MSAQMVYYSNKDVPAPIRRSMYSPTNQNFMGVTTLMHTLRGKMSK